jgi:hypothetical protein
MGRNVEGSGRRLNEPLSLNVLEGIEASVKTLPIFEPGTSKIEVKNLSVRY